MTLDIVSQDWPTIGPGQELLSAGLSEVDMDDVG